LNRFFCHPAKEPFVIQLFWRGEMSDLYFRFPTFQTEAQLIQGFMPLTKTS